MANDEVDRKCSQFCDAIEDFEDFELPKPSSRDDYGEIVRTVTFPQFSKVAADVLDGVCREIRRGGIQYLTDDMVRRRKNVSMKDQFQYVIGRGPYERVSNSPAKVMLRKYLLTIYQVSNLESGVKPHKLGEVDVLTASMLFCGHIRVTDEEKNLTGVPGPAMCCVDEIESKIYIISMLTVNREQSLAIDCYSLKRVENKLKNSVIGDKICTAQTKIFTNDMFRQLKETFIVPSKCSLAAIDQKTGRLLVGISFCDWFCQTDRMAHGLPYKPGHQVQHAELIYTGVYLERKTKKIKKKQNVWWEIRMPSSPLIRRNNETLQPDVCSVLMAHQLVRYKKGFVCGFYTIHSKPESVRPQLIDRDASFTRPVYPVHLVHFSETESQSLPKALSPNGEGGAMVIGRVGKYILMTGVDCRIMAIRALGKPGGSDLITRYRILFLDLTDLMRELVVLGLIFVRNWIDFDGFLYVMGMHMMRCNLKHSISDQRKCAHCAKLDENVEIFKEKNMCRSSFKVCRICKRKGVHKAWYLHGCHFCSVSCFKKGYEKHEKEVHSLFKE